MPARKRPPTPKPRASGPTQTDAQRREAGRVRLPTVWLTADEAAALERAREGRSVRDTLGALLLDYATSGQ